MAAARRSQVLVALLAVAAGAPCPALLACAPAAVPAEARRGDERARVRAAAVEDGAKPPAGSPAMTAPACARDRAPFSEEALRRDVALLAAPALDGRAPGSAGDVAARAYLEQRLRCFGLTPAGDDGGFEQRFVPEGPEALATANLVGYVPGTGKRADGVARSDGALVDEALASQIILVTAHHDHLGDGHLGANDNASGTAALLAVAQAVAARGGATRTIAFAAFGAEELGLVGSSYYLAHPPAALPLDRVVQVINLDMIGSYSSKKRVHAFGAFAKLPATKLLQRLDDDAPRTRFSIGGHSVRGDHHGFCALGIPYVFFWTPDTRCYHQRCDTAERVDYPHLADIAAVAGALAQQLGDADEDLAASRARHGCRPR